MTLKLILYSTYDMLNLFNHLTISHICSTGVCQASLSVDQAVGSWRMAATRKMSWALKTCL